MTRPSKSSTSTSHVSSIPRLSWISSGNRDQAHNHKVLSGLTLPAISIQSASLFNSSDRRAVTHQGLSTLLIQFLRETTSSSNVVMNRIRYERFLNGMDPQVIV